MSIVDSLPATFEKVILVELFELPKRVGDVRKSICLTLHLHETCFRKTFGV